MLLHRIKQRLYKLFLKTPVLNKFSRAWYRKLGASISDSCYIGIDIRYLGDYSNLHMAYNTSIYNGGMLVAHNKISIGENTGIAHQVLILTSSNPRGPRNKLAKVYPKMTAPVIIGANSWIGARVTILPGVTIGDFCVVAAGSVVNGDVPDYSVVAGVPAKIVKTLDPDLFKN